MKAFTDKWNPGKSSPGYTYEEAIEIDDLTWAEVLSTLKQHDADIEEFLKDVRPNGPNSLNEFTGQEVLGWLGY